MGEERRGTEGEKVYITVLCGRFSPTERMDYVALEGSYVSVWAKGMESVVLA